MKVGYIDTEDLALITMRKGAKPSFGALSEISVGDDCQEGTLALMAGLGLETYTSGT